MCFIHYVIFIILPALSFSFTCRYNNSFTVSRNTVLLELEDHNYIHIQDATFKIRPKNETTEFETMPGKNFRYIENIHFIGNLIQNGVSKYVETTLNSLIGYRYRKHGNICRVSYQKAKNKTTELTYEQEAAILRLAQSCIQSKVCNNNLNQRDRDGDLYYQSIQSEINEIIDFYVSKLLNLFLEDDKSFKIPMINVTASNVSFYAKDGFITGLDTIQRIDDILINSENSKKFTVDIELRFSKLKLFLNEMGVSYKNMGMYGNLTIQIEGISFKPTIDLDLQHDTCSVHLHKMTTFAFKRIIIDIPLWGFHLYSYNFDSENLNKLDTIILNYLVAYIPELNIDCKKYIKKLM